ncbi:Ig-like domain-containing protein [Duffyella gerundensis]|uniref:Ig-like domain-containing protein n=1 Tax=Duffyella gerundensis TaxID=1619313 RepID=UPI0021F73083|nr:Ig-like domain-containing protein [Duffyella gerundensis]
MNNSINASRTGTIPHTDRQPGRDLLASSMSAGLYNDNGSGAAVEQLQQAAAHDVAQEIALAVSIKHAEDNVGPETGDLSARQYTDDSQPTLQGAGTPNAIVKIYTERGLLGSVQVNENGEWRFTPEIALPPGVHRFRPVISHPDADNSLSGAWFELTVIAPVPLTPEIMDVRDNEGRSSWLNSGATTDDTTPTFTGFVDAPGMTILVRDHGKVTGSVEVEEYGDWTYTPNPALEAGSHSLTFEIIDSQGNVHASAPFILQITPPVSAQTAGADEQTDKIIEAAEAAAKATAEQAAAVEAAAKAAAEQAAAAEAAAKAAAEQAAAVEAAAKAAAEQAAAAEAAASASSASGEGSKLVPLTSQIPTIDSIHDGQGRQGLVAPGGTSDDTMPTLRGQGEPGATIVVRDLATGDSAEVKVDSEGWWAWKPVASLSEGEHIFTVVGIDENGDEYGDVSALFPINIVHPTDNGITSVTDDVGDTETLLAGAQTDDARPTLHGFGLPYGDIWIYDNGRLLGSGIINGKGEWSFTPEQPLSEGIHQFSAMSTDLFSGARTPSSPTFELEIVPVAVVPENINRRSLLQEADAPLFAEAEPALSTTQPAEPVGFVPASPSLLQTEEMVLPLY